MMTVESRETGQSDRAEEAALVRSYVDSGAERAFGSIQIALWV